MIAKMKGLKTVAANLANRINQPHYLEVELAKVFEAGVKYGIEQSKLNWKPASQLPENKDMQPKEKAQKLYKQIETITTTIEGETQPQYKIREVAMIIAEECFNEAYKQFNEISMIREDFWRQVKKEINLL